MKDSGSSCGCKGEWNTLQRQEKKKKKTRPSQILLKFRYGFRFAAGSQSQKNISMEFGNFPFGIYILQQIPFSVKQLQENLDLNIKGMGKIQIQIWSLHLPHFWSNRGTTLTSAVHQMIWSQCYAFFLSFSFPPYFLSIQDWLKRDMLLAVKIVYPIRLLNKFSSMIYGHGKEFQNFQKNILLSPSFSALGRLAMEKLEPWEKIKKNYRKLFSLDWKQRKRKE